MGDMLERVALALCRQYEIDGEFSPERAARVAIEAMRELPEEPGTRYSAGEYSRANVRAMVDDALTPHLGGIDVRTRD